MKKIFSILCAALLFSTSFSAISKVSANISSSKSFGDERDVKNFSGVAAGGPINVAITIGNTEGCRLEGDAEALETLITEVKGNVLIIRPENSWKSWEKKYENKKITAYVTVRSIKSLTMSGSGSMVVNGAVNTKDLAATLSGSGSIKVTADVDDFTGVISGSGNITITGKADDANVTISGSGTFAGKGFSVNDLSTQVSGSGSVNINADRKIDAVISGSGNINYSGNASVEKTVVGSGRVRKI